MGRQRTAGSKETKIAMVPTEKRHRGHVAGGRHGHSALAGRWRAGVGSCVGIDAAAVGAGALGRVDGSRGSSCSGRGCGFLDGTGMVGLVASEWGAAGEGRLAVGVRTVVWACAGVNSSVSGERARIAERLMDVSDGKPTRCDFGSLPWCSAHTCEASRRCERVHGQSKLTVG